MFTRSKACGLDREADNSGTLDVEENSHDRRTFPDQSVVIQLPRDPNLESMITEFDEAAMHSLPFCESAPRWKFNSGEHPNLVEEEKRGIYSIANRGEFHESMMGPEGTRRVQFNGREDSHESNCKAVSELPHFPIPLSPVCSIAYPSSRGRCGGLAQSVLPPVVGMSEAPLVTLGQEPRFALDTQGRDSRHLKVDECKPRFSVEIEREEVALLEAELSLRRRKLELLKKEYVYQDEGLASNRGTTSKEQLEQTVEQQHWDPLRDLATGLLLPRLEVEPFAGSVLQFHGFMKSFEMHIANRVSDVGLRLAYLIQKCEGQAKQDIHHCQMMDPAEGYKEALSILKARYGRPHDVIQAATEGLFEGPKISPGNVEGLKSLVSQMRSCHSIVSQLGRVCDLDCTPSLVRIVERLPQFIKDKWAEASEAMIVHGHYPNFLDLLDFLDKRVSVASSVYGQVAARRVQHHSFVEARSAATIQTKSITQCVLCRGDHDLSVCTAFLAMTHADRWVCVKRHRCCFLCLKRNHTSRSCHSSAKCLKPGCDQRHHVLLHIEPAHDVLKVSVTNCGASRPSPVILGCVPVRIVTPTSEVSTYAFLDNGSDTTLVSRALADSLNLGTEPCVLNVNTVNGLTRISSGKLRFAIAPLDGSEYVTVDSAYLVNELPIATAPDTSCIDVVSWPHLKDVCLEELADKSVGLLIGCDVPEAHVAFDQRIGCGKQPHAVKSMFGWVLRGPCGRTAHTRLVNYVGTEEESLDEMLARYFEVEFKDPSGPDTKGMSLDDRHAVQCAEKSIELVGQKFVVGLPWRQNSSLPSNYRQARRRLELLRKRLSRNTELLHKYAEQMEMHVKKGYMSIVTNADSNRWFLPHHPVLNPNKPGKVRIVFDCAARFCNHSLNDALLSGPNITNDLTGVLTRFRKHKVAFCADIQEMFLQVGVPNRDRRFLSLLWWSDTTMAGEPDIFQLNVHPFGATSSPFCASFALRRTGLIFGSSVSDSCKRAIESNFYVDDCLVSTESLDEARCLVSELRGVLALGGFRLTKWNSNVQDVLSALPEEDKVPVLGGRDLCTESLQGTLGLQWDVVTDTFRVRLNLPEHVHTRRGMLTCIATLYDPLGFVAPLTLPARQLVQQLTRSGIGWDAPLPDLHSKLWKRWLIDITSVERLRIPRFLGISTADEQALELHVFSDASDSGYGAVGYLRTVATGSIRCAFFMGKSRVAPRKVTTLPRMELVAAVLSSKLMTHLVSECQLSFKRIIMWTDSTIVLHYLANSRSRFKTFVANRVRIIQDMTEGCSWRHVPSSMNPADVGSRGSSAALSSDMNLWLNGPEFLRQDEFAWPPNIVIQTNLMDDLELKTVAPVVQSDVWQSRLFLRYSSWLRLLRCVAWLIRFKGCLVSIVRKDDSAPTTGSLSVAELDKARADILKLVQQERLGCDESTVVRKLKKLSPIRLNGLWCVGGRLQLSSCDVTRHPVILPDRHPVTDLLIHFQHESDGHVGPMHVLTNLRRRFWIVKGMAQVKRVLRECARCRLLYASPMNQIMAPIPAERVSDGGHPFRVCGVDYFGPFRVKIGRSDHKRYGCLFTCLQTRAVHIEVAHSLSSDSFLMAMMRFIDRRGPPEVIWSDNGTNFVGAERHLFDLFRQVGDNKIIDHLAGCGVQWRFNPPGVSHRGGIWERIVRSVKRVLAAIANEQSMNEETLLTSMIQVERILNDRPIVPSYDDPASLRALTPSDLLLPYSASVGLPAEVSLPERYKRNYKFAQHIANVFWKRWVREYLPLLQVRSKWTKVHPDLKNGDLVLLLDRDKPRGVWKKAIVEQIRPSADGHSRDAEVRTVDGLVWRDIRSLCLLEGTVN